jgi:hypothetical protein
MSVTNIIIKQHTNNNYLEMQALYTVMIIKVVQRYVLRINYSTFKYETIELNGTLRIGEFQVTLHFLNIMEPRPRRDRGPLFLRNGEIRGHSPT